MLTICLALFDVGARGDQFCVDVAGGQQAEVTDLDEAARQDVLQEAAHEFQRREATHLFVPRAKDDFRVVDVEQSAVRDGNAVGVEAQIPKQRARILERRLGVDHPVLLVERVFETRESAGVSKIRDDVSGARTLHEFAIGEKAGEAIEEFAAKQFARTFTGSRYLSGESTQTPSRLRPPPVTMQCRCG